MQSVLLGPNKCSLSQRRKLMQCKASIVQGENGSGGDAWADWKLGGGMCSHLGLVYVCVLLDLEPFFS